MPVTTRAAGTGLFALVLAGLALGCGPTEAPFDPQPFTERGVAVTSATFSVMSSRLKAKLEEGGVPAAIDYCSLAAYPLTDSLAAAHEAQIRRTALRFRNPANAPDDAERARLERYQAALAAGEPLAPVVQRLEDGTVAFYAPIVLADPCVACHGTVGEQVSPADYALIRERYPDDTATGFAPGDLRGMWSLRLH